MSGHPRRAALDLAAGRLAMLGSALGVIAGVVDTVAGASIRPWVGNKLDTTILGLATVALSAIGLAAAIAWRRPGGRAGGRRLVTVLALAVPAAVCFTTVGRLWYVPGTLLLLAGVLVVGASTKGELTSAINERRWRRGLTAILGGYYVFLGADALGMRGLLGIIGGLVIWTALLTARNSPRRAYLLLALGALPFALATWWSVVTPLLALLVLIIGASGLRRRAAPPPQRQKHAVRVDHRLAGTRPSAG